MKRSMKAVYLFIFALITSGTMLAQMPGGAGGQSMNMGHFYGKVVDAKNNKPLEAASIQLTQNRMDTATKKRRDMVIAALLTDKKGEFSIDKLPVLGSFKLSITAIGFSEFDEKISFNLKMSPGADMSQMLNAVDKDLGNIKMTPNEEQLAGVVVEANKPMMQMNIDRKVFNVDKSLTSVGGSALDVMKNVPSVNVDIDGNVTLRNATPQIFVDGRPTTLTLDEIPADEIESVEIITNPSAKFDAGGGGSGILNLVMKKNRKAGYNGSLRANLDSRLKYGLGGDINIKQGKINFFANGAYNQRKSITTSTANQENYINGTVANLTQVSKPVSLGHFAYGRVGFDYLPDIRNTFTVSEQIVGGSFESTNLLNIMRDTTIGPYFSEQTGIDNSYSNFTFHNYGSVLSFKHNFAKPDKNITADLNYNYSTNTSFEQVATQYYNLDNSPYGPLGQQMSNSAGTTKYFVGQTDYSDPVTDKIKIESGLRAAVRNYNSSNENYNYDSTVGKFLSETELNSQYAFTDQVYAGYMTFSQKISSFTYQLGGRLESSEYKGTLIDSNQIFRNSYPLSFFPSVFLTKKLNDKQDLQLNYSRKISRPNFFQLIPYYNFSDSLNITRGNPNLRPAFTNLFEFSYDLNFKNGNNIIATAYYRHTDNLITSYSYRTQNPNTAINDSILVWSFANANSSQSYGLEVTSTNKIATWWTLVSNINFYNSLIDASNLQPGLSNQRVSYFGKLNNTFTLPKNYSIQLTGDYTSKTIVPPGGGGGGRMFGGPPLSVANGYTDPIYGVDMAIKKTLLKDKSASISISMNDIFRTRISKVYSQSDISPTIYTLESNIRIRDPQLVRLNFNWRFGKFDTSLFKRKNEKADQEGLQNGMQGVSQ